MASDKSSSRPFTVIVEGNIGSGKSTFLDLLSRSFPAGQVETLTEPVSKWRSVKGKHNLLQLMYEDPHRWSLAFQSYVQLTMMELHVKKSSAAVKVMERSVYSGRHCFVENLYRTGKLPPSEYAVLTEWFDFLTSSALTKSVCGAAKPGFDVGVDLVVYLRTTPEIAWQRVKARARKEEKVIPIEYLRELHELHESWLMSSPTSSSVPAPVLVIDADEDLVENPDCFSRHAEDIVEKAAGKNKSAVTVAARQQPKRILGEVNR